MRLPLWPRSVFGRLIAALVIAVVCAQAASLFLFARDLERVVVASNVEEWSQRITVLTHLLEQIPRQRRAAAISQIKEQVSALAAQDPRGGAVILSRGRSMAGRVILNFRAAATAPLPSGAPGPLFMLRSMPIPARCPMAMAAPPIVPAPSVTVTSSRPPPAAPSLMAVAVASGPLLVHGPGPVLQSQQVGRLALGPLSAVSWPHISIPLPFASQMHAALEQQLRADLGSAYTVAVRSAVAPAAQVISVPSPQFGLHSQRSTRSYDVHVRLPDGTALIYRVTSAPLTTALPQNLLLNLSVLLILLVITLYFATRSITRPLSHLAQAADNLGRDIGQPKLREHGALELRRAARAFNTMQDRLRRYLDSRTRVLAAMSHDLKTPLTRMRLQVETYVEQPALRKRLRKELDEMQSMVWGALALFRGLNDQERLENIDVDSLLETVRENFAQMSKVVTIAGRTLGPFPGKAHALKRCISNLVANAVTFGTRATILVEDGAQLQITICDDGPGIPPAELENVFEPFYRVESSRNRDTGGTGLGLGIARDVAQTHGGSLVLRNRPEGGLEARLTLPRGR